MWPDNIPHWVYFTFGLIGKDRRCKERGEGAIKIGHSWNARLRAQTLRRDIKGDIVPFCKIERIGKGAAKELEKSLHKRFARYRIGESEWFEPKPELLRWIADALESGEAVRG